jgi:hypothetical protein
MRQTTPAIALFSQVEHAAAREPRQYSRGVGRRSGAVLQVNLAVLW